MANFKEVNKFVKTNFPSIDVEVVRGEGYVYYFGNDSDKLESIMTHPTSTSTEDLCYLVAQDLSDLIGEK